MRHLVTLALLLTVLGYGVGARAQDKEQCVQAYEDAQTLRAERKLIEAHARLITCTNASCPQAISWRLPLLQTSIVPEGGSHVERLATAGNWQPAVGLQVSLVQGLPSLQFGAWPPTQRLLWQVSTPSQALPLLQLVGAA